MSVFVNDFVAFAVGDVVQFYNVYCNFPSYDYSHVDPKARQVSYFETLSGLVLGMQHDVRGHQQTVGVSLVIASAFKYSNTKQNQMFSMPCEEDVTAYTGKICKVFLFNTSHVSDKFSILSKVKDAL